MKRSVSDVITGGGDQVGAYKADGTINTTYIPNCIYLSNADKKKVIDERKKQGARLGDGKGSKTGNEQDNIKELNKKKSKFKRNIKSLKKKITNDNYGGDNTDKTDDADDKFGGKQSNKKSKKG